MNPCEKRSAQAARVKKLRMATVERSRLAFRASVTHIFLATFIDSANLFDRTESCSRVCNREPFRRRKRDASEND